MAFACLLKHVYWQFGITALTLHHLVWELGFSYGFLNKGHRTLWLQKKIGQLDLPIFCISLKKYFSNRFVWRRLTNFHCNNFLSSYKFIYLFTLLLSNLYCCNRRLGSNCTIWSVKENAWTNKLTVFSENNFKLLKFHDQESALTLNIVSLLCTLKSSDN